MGTDTCLHNNTKNLDTYDTEKATETVQMDNQSQYDYFFVIAIRFIGLQTMQWRH